MDVFLTGANVWGDDPGADREPEPDYAYVGPSQTQSQVWLSSMQQWELFMLCIAIHATLT